MAMLNLLDLGAATIGVYLNHIGILLKPSNYPKTGSDPNACDLNEARREQILPEDDRPIGRSSVGADRRLRHNFRSESNRRSKQEKGGVRVGRRQSA